MVPRIRLPNRFQDEERSAFARGPKERHLRIVVDASSLAQDEVSRHLLGFQHHPSVDMAIVGGEGRQTLEFESWHPGQDYLRFAVRSPAGWSAMVVVGADQFRRFAAEDAAKGVGEEQANFDSLVLSAASREWGADALVTSRPYLLSPTRANLVGQSNPMRGLEGLALVGLYLRSRDDFTYWMDERVSARMNRGLFYWVLTRDLLPSAWRWFGACVASMSATGEDTAEHLAESALRRVDRALRARDRLQVEMKLPQDNDTADEALFMLDVMLLMIGGAFDAVARIAHIVYSLAGDWQYASWRRDAWRDALRGAAPRLAALMDRGTEPRDALDIVALLRNQIHGEAPRALAYVRHAASRENLLVLPASARAALEEISDRRGGPHVWGLREMGPGKACVEPDRFAETLFPFAVRALDAVIAHTQTELLPGVDSAAVMDGPPDEAPFSPEIRAAVRRLAGL